MHEQVDDGDIFAIAYGREFIRFTDDYTGPEKTPDLETNLALWRELWNAHKNTVLVWWIERDPGTRPKGWHRFGRGRLPAWDPDSESQVEYLFRHGQLSEDELAVIVQRAQWSAQYYRLRSPVWLDDLSQFCLDHNLVDDRSREVLTRIDAKREQFDDEEIDAANSAETIDDGPRIPKPERATYVEESKPRPSPRPGANDHHPVRNYATDGRRTERPRYDDRPRPTDGF
jgi:hypothetical protein